MTRSHKDADIRIDNESKASYDQLRAVMTKLPPDALMKQLEAEFASPKYDSDIPF
jgi:hypothetical protein